jgi:myo-inositol-1(or 4)-monophosphatase
MRPTKQRGVVCIVEIDGFIQDVARGAGRIIMDKYATVKSTRQKSSPGDIVTEVDLASEEYIVSRVTKKCPDAGILSEECGSLSEDKGGGVWVIDPIDGTRNYVVGIPMFCVSIGIMKNGRAEVGAIYDPVHDEMFFARPGAGATLNGERFTTSTDTTLEDTLINVSWMRHRKDRHLFIEYIERLSNDTSYFRRFGSAALALAYVACGRLHGYIQSGVKAWDVCAGIAICEQAGAVVTDFGNKPVDLTQRELEILAANSPIHAQLLDVIHQTRSEG